MIMKTNKFILISLFQFFSISAYAQLTQTQLDSLVKVFTTVLKQRAVDTICVYKQYCIGCLFQASKGSNLCAENYASLPTYIFWKEKGKTFVTRKDICFDYSTQLLPSDSIWYFYFNNQEKIKKESLKIPQYAEIVNGKKIIQTVKIDHSIFFHITVSTLAGSITKEINSFYLTRELGINEVLNINYEYNNSTGLNNLHQIIQRIIKHDSVKQKFVRTLR